MTHELCRINLLFFSGLQWTKVVVLNEHPSKMAISQLMIPFIGTPIP